MIRRYPDLRNGIFLCLLFLIFQVVVSLFIARVTGSKGLMIITSILVPPLLILAIAARANNATITRGLHWGRAQRKTVLPLVLMTVSLAFIVSEAENLVIQYLIPRGLYEQYLRQFMELMFFESPTDLVCGLVSIALVGPFMEEAVFRGTIYRGIASHRGTTYGVAASSLLFMAVHINPLQFPGALVLGLIYATMISRGYGIADTFIAHSLHNTISLSFLLGALKVPGMNPAQNGEVAHVSIGIIAASLVGFTAGLSFVLRWAPGMPTEEEGAARAGR